MSNDAAKHSSDQQLRPLPLALTAVAVVVAGITPAVFAQLPASAQPWNLSIIGALGIFAASRLGFWWGVGFLGLAIACKDISIYLIHGWPPSLLSWPCFIGYALIGWISLRRTGSPIRIGATALTGSLLFFFVSNFCCWLQPNLGYERSLKGLTDCYIAAVPFFRGTLLGDLGFAVVLFGAYALLGRVYSPANQRLTVTSQELR